MLNSYFSASTMDQAGEIVEPLSTQRALCAGPPASANKLRCFFVNPISLVGSHLASVMGVTPSQNSQKNSQFAKRRPEMSSSVSANVVKPRNVDEDNLLSLNVTKNRENVSDGLKEGTEFGALFPLSEATTEVFSAANSVIENGTKDLVTPMLNNDNTLPHLAQEIHLSVPAEISVKRKRRREALRSEDSCLGANGRKTLRRSKEAADDIILPLERSKRDAGNISLPFAKSDRRVPIDYGVKRTGGLSASPQDCYRVVACTESKITLRLSEGTNKHNKDKQNNKSLICLHAEEEIDNVGPSEASAVRKRCRRASTGLQITNKHNKGKQNNKSLVCLHAEEEVDNVGPEASAIRKRCRRASTGLQRSKNLVQHPTSIEYSPNFLLLEREKVRRALQTYDALRRKLEQVRKDRPADFKGERPDMVANTRMNKGGFSINRDRKFIGHVPGVNVGDIFCYRAELCVVGLHTQVISGIDYLTGKNNTAVGSGSSNTAIENVAISIISSGGYEDNEDSGERLIYTGQGGCNWRADKKQSRTQELKRGNLALEKSMHHGTPIRVIRGFKDAASPSGRIYVYDGLYEVHKSWFDKGKSNFGVYMFELHRISGQPILGSGVLKLCNKWVRRPHKKNNAIIPDISYGKENIPVCITNDDYDDMPADFRYSTQRRYANTIPKLKPARPCECTGLCSAESCSCIRLNGGETPYTDGFLVRGKNVIYECGEQCKCLPTCPSRVAQKGLHRHLEVFKTADKGWGVRSWEAITAGSFVCEYTGEVFPDSDSEDEDDGDTDHCLHFDDSMEQNQLEYQDIYSALDENWRTERPCRSIKFDIAIDAGRTGNVARFMNHNCSPNLVKQCVLYDHHDTQFPHIMLFAKESIPPMTELTFHYCDGDSQRKNRKRKRCLCEAPLCRGSF